MFKSFSAGIKRANASQRLLLWLLATNILFVLPLIVPVFLLIQNTTQNTLLAQEMLADKLDVAWVIDFLNNQLKNGSFVAAAFHIGAQVYVVGMLYLLVNLLFAGGILASFTTAEPRFSLRTFWAGGGAYFWRFLRLWLIALLFYGAAFAVYALLRIPVRRADALATAASAVQWQKLLAAGVLLLLLAFVNMVFDYARIATVLHDRSRMLRETRRACGFALRHFGQTYGLYLLLAVLGGALFLLLAWLRSTVEQSSFLALNRAIVYGQMAVAVRLWTRLASYAAALDLYQRLVPVTAPVETPLPAHSFEFRPATGELPKLPPELAEPKPEAAQDAAAKEASA